MLRRPGLAAFDDAGLHRQVAVEIAEPTDARVRLRRASNSARAVATVANSSSRPASDNGEPAS